MRKSPPKVTKMSGAVSVMPKRPPTWSNVWTRLTSGCALVGLEIRYSDAFGTKEVTRISPFDLMCRFSSQTPEGKAWRTRSGRGGGEPSEGAIEDAKARSFPRVDRFMVRGRTKSARSRG